MSNVEYCSFVGEDFIICDCGNNFSDEHSLRSHLELEHDIRLQLEEPEVSVNIPTPASPVIVKEECEASETLFLKSEPSDPEDRNFDSHYDESTNHDLHQTAKPFCKLVLTKDKVVERPVILVGGNKEHNYDRETRNREKEAVCDMCGQAYNSTRALKIHMKRHIAETDAPPRPSRKTNTTEVVCDLCGKKYKSNAALRYHTRVHTGEKPYQCVYCPKAFTMPLFLQLHTRTHTGERPYPCQLCEKKFSNKAALARHDRVHTGEKPYECQFCRKSFTQSNSMKLHITTVHLKLPSPYKSHSRQARQQKRLESTNKMADESRHNCSRRHLSTAAVVQVPFVCRSP